MDAEEKKFLNAWNAIPGVGAVTLRALKTRFRSFERAWRANADAYGSARLDAQARKAILQFKKSTDPDREMQKLAASNIWMIVQSEKEYPALLAEIPVPPAVLYGRGDKSALEKNTGVGVVGTRRPTPYGMEAAEEIVGTLAGAGLTIISGLAAGIDAKAHKTALEQKGLTVAVLGSGIDPLSIFPPENRGLAERIAESGGAVISEYSPGTPAVKEHFPMRNRIISGLSRATLVVEARERSGALITARLALEQNRDVFAVPGSIFSATSRGPNALIREGALAVGAGIHILDALGLADADGFAGQSRGEINQEEKKLLDLLETPHSIDEIKKETGMATGAIVSSISLLEMKGHVKNMGPDIFQKI